MRSRYRRAIHAGAALVLGAAAGVATAVAGASPALAAMCWGETPTIVATNSGSWFGTAGHDVVEILVGGVDYTPNGTASDSICIRTSAGATIWSGGFANNITGGPGPDFINGTDGNDTIFAGGGNDVIRGFGGADIIQGDDGDDYIRGDAGGAGSPSVAQEKLRGGNGNDCILGGGGFEVITAGAGDDTVLPAYENRFSDTQCAPAENDNSPAAVAFRNNLDSAGAKANGDSGNDRIWGSKSGDDLDGGDGNDIVNGWAGNDSIEDVTGVDVLKGGAGDDLIIDWDSVGGDQLFGGSGTGDDLRAHDTDTCFPDNGPATTPCL